MSTALTRDVFARWPILAMAAERGLIVEVARGVYVGTRPHVQGDRVVLPIFLPPTVVQTPVGEVTMQGAVQLDMRTEDFARALELAERTGLAPRIVDMLTGASTPRGRPLLNLPRG